MWRIHPKGRDHGWVPLRRRLGGLRVPTGGRAGVLVRCRSVLAVNLHSISCCGAYPNQEDRSDCARIPHRLPIIIVLMSCDKAFASRKNRYNPRCCHMCLYIPIPFSSGFTNLNTSNVTPSVCDVRCLDDKRQCLLAHVRLDQRAMPNS